MYDIIAYGLITLTVAISFGAILLMANALKTISTHDNKKSE